MILTQEQQAILDGQKGETLAKVMKTLVMYGDAFEAEKLVPITSKYNHLVTSFGLKVMAPVYDLMQTLLDAGVASEQQFSVDPRPIDKNVPANILQKLVFNKFMYTKQDFYEEQLQRLGLMNKNAFSCTCYMDEVGNKPQKGDILSWAESSAVVYANSVLGARCNRNSGIIDIMGSIVGYVPYFGLLTDEGRKATWIIKVNTTKKPEAQLLGSAIGMKVMEDVPNVLGLDKWIGTELNDEACSYLKDFGAATASNGAVGLYHIENLTPEAKELGESLIVEGANEYIIDDAELERVQREYPVVWKNPDAKPEMLVQFAVLGSVYAKTALGMQNPKVGLANIGEEEEKGNAQTQAAHALMKENKSFEFFGNAEPVEIFKNNVDVVVCDGFVGNMLMKHTEALARVFAKRGLVDEYVARFNYEIYGGLPLLGANSIVLIGHGISNAKAIKSMIFQSKNIYETNLIGQLKETLSVN